MELLLLAQALPTLTMGQWALVIATIAIIVLMMFMSFIKSLIWVCRPNQILIFSGRKHNVDGATVGFRVSHAGLSFRMPIIETVSTMDVSLIPLELSISNAYSKGNIPLNVHAIANFKISSNPKIVINAIERFLGRSKDEIARVVKETLEGSLRGVLATLTPEQVNEDKLKFAESLSDEVEDDLEKLGLHLDTLKIQHVHDGDGSKYLENIGRQQIAYMIRDAENAESNAKSEASLIQSATTATAREAKESAQKNITKSRNELQRYKADLKGAVKAEEEKTLGAARQARAVAEQQLQEMRRNVEEKRLEVEVIIPADIQREAQNLLAKGSASPVAENGAAVAKVLAMMSDAWIEAGPHAKEIFLVQQIDTIVRQVANGVKDLKVGEVNLIDNGDGSALAGYVRSLPATMNALFQELQTTTGIDIAKTIGGQKGA
jgi:flotillin